MLKKQIRPVFSRGPYVTPCDVCAKIDFLVEVMHKVFVCIKNGCHFFHAELRGPSDFSDRPSIFWD